MSNWGPDSEDSSEIVSCLRHVLLWVWLGQTLRMFAEARPPGIYKQDYIDKLFTFYHERKPQSLVYPSTPEWKRPATVDLNEVASTDQDDDDEDDGGLLAALQVGRDELWLLKQSS